MEYLCPSVVLVVPDGVPLSIGGAETDSPLVGVTTSQLWDIICWRSSSVASAPFIDLHDDHYAWLYDLLELVEVQLDVVNSVDGAKSFPFDHPQGLHKRHQSWVGPKDPHLFQLPEKNSRVCFWVALLHFAVVEQLLLQPL